MHTKNPLSADLLYFVTRRSTGPDPAISAHGSLEAAEKRKALLTIVHGHDADEVHIYAGVRT
jgi:hypothetical protein